MLASSMLLLLTATPVTLQLELAGPPPAEVHARVREVLEQRLREDGFPVAAGARLALLVEEKEGVLRLTASMHGQRFAGELARGGAGWDDAFSLTLAQRLTALASEAAKTAPADLTTAPLAPEPAQPAPVDRLLEEPTPAPAPAPRPAFRVSASVRLGALVRPPDVDATMSLAASLAGPVVEPLVLMGVVAARSRDLTAWQTPLAAGARVPFQLGAWHLIPEALIGIRLHSWVPTALDPGGTEVDLTGLFGFSVLYTVGPFKVGLRVGLDVAPARQHVFDQQLVWSRGALGFSTQLHFER